MISAWDTFFEVDEYYTYKKPVGHGAYGVVISALDTRDNTKVPTCIMVMREVERIWWTVYRGKTFPRFNCDLEYLPLVWTVCVMGRLD